MFLPIPSYSSFNVKSTGRPPHVTPVNDSLVQVNYQDAFIIEDFSEVVKIEFFNRPQEEETPEYFALASRQFGYRWTPYTNRINQKLKEGSNILAKMNTCKTYNFLYVTITGNEGHKDSIQFDYKPDEICEEQSLFWICYEDDSITLSQKKSEFFEVRNCIQKVEIFDANEDIVTLTEGKNQNLTSSMAKEVKLFIPYNEKSKTKEFELFPCTEQRKWKILNNTSDWICVNESNAIYYFKSEWEDFHIEEIYYQNI